MKSRNKKNDLVMLKMNQINFSQSLAHEDNEARTNSNNKIPISN